MFAGDVATQAVGWVALVACVGLAYRWASELERDASGASRRASALASGSLAAATIAGSPIAFYLAATGYVEPLLALLGGASLYAADRVRGMARDRIDTTWLVAAGGLLAGSAASVKYHGLYFVLAAAILMLWTAARHASRRTILRDLVVYGVAATAAMLPCYGRLLAETGNPVFPFYPELFGENPWGLPVMMGPSGAERWWLTRHAIVGRHVPSRSDRQTSALLARVPARAARHRDRGVASPPVPPAAPHRHWLYGGRAHARALPVDDRRVVERVLRRSGRGLAERANDHADRDGGDPRMRRRRLRDLSTVSPWAAACHERRARSTDRQPASALSRDRVAQSSRWSGHGVRDQRGSDGRLRERHAARRLQRPGQFRLDGSARAHDRKCRIRARRDRRITSPRARGRSLLERTGVARSAAHAHL